MYVALDVGLHGLRPASIESVRQRVLRALNVEFDPEMESDLTVEVTESAGAPSDGRTT